MRAIKTISSLIQSERYLFLLLLTPFIYMFLLVVFNGIPDLPNSGDSALLELNTRNVFSRGILLGPYSRFIFFHPGPLYFQLRYPVYELFGQMNSSLLIATLIIQSACLFFTWRTVKGIKKGLTATLFSLCAALYLLTTEKTIWLSEWNPHIIIFPFMLFIVAMAASASGRLKYLVTAVVAGSFAAQTHISVIPSMAVLTIAAMVFAVYPWFLSSRRNSNFQKKPVLISIGVLLVLWAAPIYQQFFPGNGEGNMTRIVHYFSESTPYVDHSRAFALWSSVLTDMELGDQAGQGLRGAVIALRVLLLAAMFIIQRKKGDRPFLAALALFLLMLHMVSWFSVLQIRGELHSYLIQWMGVIPLLSLFVILSAIADRAGQSAVKYMKIAATVFLVYSAVALPIKIRDFYRTELHPSWQNEIAVRELSEQLRNNLEWDGETFYVISLVTTDQWPIMFGLLNSMEKMDLPVGVEDNLLYIPTPVPEGMHPRTLHLGVLNQQGLMMPGLAANWNGIGLILQ